MPQQPKPFNLFAGPYLDRNAWEREDTEWFVAARRDAGTRYLLARGTTHLVVHEPAPHVVFLGGDDPRIEYVQERQAVLLGWFDGARCVLVEEDAGARDDAAAPDSGPGGRFEELRPLSADLPEREAGLLAYARALTIWRTRHRYCGACGAPTRPVRAGHVLACSNRACGQEMFPRIDPAIIVLVTDGERALLGRQASWPPGRYSTIAGFVEPGESVEDAVAREVAEETGIGVGEVTYHSSQPWPFPSSLMLGFHAQATSFAITRRDGELEDAQWFTRAAIASGHPRVGARSSISWRLIEAWFDAGWPTPLAQVRG
ncbi:MAG: NAD(+) diphosphatase [Steroidobacteraceae bacterium]